MMAKNVNFSDININNAYKRKYACWEPVQLIKCNAVKSFNIHKNFFPNLATLWGLYVAAKHSTPGPRRNVKLIMQHLKLSPVCLVDKSQLFYFFARSKISPFWAGIGILLCNYFWIVMLLVPHKSSQMRIRKHEE